MPSLVVILCLKGLDSEQAPLIRNTIILISFVSFFLSFDVKGYKYT